MACVQDALRRGLIRDAFELALPLPDTPDQMGHGERLLVEVLEAVSCGYPKEASRFLKSVSRQLC